MKIFRIFHRLLPERQYWRRKSDFNNNTFFSLPARLRISVFVSCSVYHSCLLCPLRSAFTNPTINVISAGRRFLKILERNSTVEVFGYLKSLWLTEETYQRALRPTYVKKPATWSHLTPESFKSLLKLRRLEYFYFLMKMWREREECTYTK